MKTQRNLAVLWITFISVLRLHGASTVQFTQSAAYTVAENAGTVSLPVQRIDDANAVVSVDYASRDGTALAGLKYTSVSGTLTFAAGEINKTIVVPILNDGIVGGTQDFQVVLSNPTGAILGVQSNATVRITDNDKGLQLEFGSYSVAEDAGTVLIAVLRRDDGNFPVTVDYATTDGTAKSGVDYTGVTNTLSFAAEEMLKLFTVPILNDALKEPNKSFRLALNNPTGGGVLGAPKTVTVTILDNDPGVQFEFSNYWVGEDEDSVTVKVLRGRDANMEPFTLDYATTAGTALAGQDYIETHGTLTFEVGQTAHQVTVPVLRNESSTADRQFKMTLSSPSAGAVLGPNRTATVTVLDTTGMQPHRIGGIKVQSDNSIVLTFEGGVHKRFKDYFDLYPLEVSTDLATWIPWTTLQRTNASTNTLTYTIPAQGGTNQMFFRTAAGPLITPYRQPTGPFAVGSITRLVSDPSRRNRYAISTNDSFMVTIWYPAVGQARELPEPLEYPVEHDNASRSDSSFLHDRYRSFFTHALVNAAWPPTPSKFPVILYSHGGTSLRSQRLEMGPDLASHGYVFVVMDHFDSWITSFPDDSVRYGPITPTGDVNVILTEAGFQDRLQDLEFVLNLLTEWNSSDPLLSGRFDLDRLGTMGFSWGGGVAAEFARLNRRVKAVVLLDAYLQNANELVRAGLSKPFIGIYSTQGGGETSLYNHKATTAAIWFIISNSEHSQFSDHYWVNYPGEVKDSREIIRTLGAYALWFLNRYVKEQEEPMPALKDYPRITGFKQK